MSTLNKDSQLILSFYGLFFLSMLIFFTLLNYKTSPAKHYSNVGLGLFWLLSGSYFALRLQQHYGKSFWQLSGRAQKFILIPLLIAGFGGFMVFWSTWFIIKS